VLEDRAVPAALLRLAALGDSLSAAYPPNSPWGAGGDHSWTEQLQALRPGKIQVTTLAVPGATSADVLAGQAPQAAALVAQGRVDAVSLIVGADDVFSHLPILAGDHPEAFVPSFVTDVTSNIAHALDVLEAAGARVVVSNLPDVAGAPGYQLFVAQKFGGLAPLVLEETTVAIAQANQQIGALAGEKGVPLIDLFGLTELGKAPFTVGGVAITDPYSPDHFHPDTVGQAILGNAVLEALHEGYHVPLQPLRLSDQEVLAEAGIDPGRHRPRTYFDVTPYVLVAEEPACP
jgi:lysophospholipase L1-like esterase